MPKVETITEAQAIAATRQGKKVRERIRWATGQILGMKPDQVLVVTPDDVALYSLKRAFKDAALALGLVMRLRCTEGKLYVWWAGATIPLPDGEGEGPSPFTARADGQFHLGKAKDGPALDQGVAPKAGAVPHALEVFEDVAGCYWASGLHQHRLEDDQAICLAPVGQWKKPVPGA